MKRCAFGILALVAILPLTMAQPSAFKLTPQEEELLELTNKERKNKDLKPLRPNEILFKVARAHSQNMAKQKNMNHVLDGKTPYDRVKAAGYRYAKAAENVAEGDDGITIPVIMKAWMDSEGHRKNMLTADFIEIGLGEAKDDQGKSYYTQVFGKPFGK